MRFILFALTLSLLLVVAMSAQTGKTWNYALLGESSRTRVWTGSSWEIATHYDSVFSDSTQSQCQQALTTFAIALSQPTVVRRFWVDVKDQLGAPCNVIIKASASGAVANIGASTTFMLGSREIFLPNNNVAYKYFEITSVSQTIGNVCNLCGFEVFSG